MATKIPPKNFDNKLSRRKQDLDQIAKNEEDIAALQALPVLPTPTEGDTGKVVKVGSDGGYELGTDEGLPSVSTSFRSLSSIGSSWYVVSTAAMGSIEYTLTGSSIASRSYAGSSLTTAAFRNIVAHQSMNIIVSYNGIVYTGFTISTSDQNTSMFLCDTDGNNYIGIDNGSNFSITRISQINYIDITASGSSVSLPSGVTYADIVTFVEAGVNVQLRQVLSSSNRYFHLAAYDETSGIYFENSYFAGTELSLNEIHLNETVSEIRHKTITFDT